MNVGTVLLSTIMISPHVSSDCLCEPVCDYRFYGISDPNQVLLGSGYETVTPEQLSDTEIRDELYAQYNAQGGLYPLGSWAPNSCCLNRQDGLELQYGDSVFVFVAADNEGRFVRGTPCTTTSYDVNRLYVFYRGQHPGVLLSTLNESISFVNSGQECTSRSNPMIVRRCVEQCMEVTDMPTTAMPTTMMPTTAMPTTAMPTTAMPTTAMPTTAMPTDSSDSSESDDSVDSARVNDKEQLDAGLSDVGVMDEGDGRNYVMTVNMGQRSILFMWTVIGVCTFGIFISLCLWQRGRDRAGFVSDDTRND